MPVLSEAAYAKTLLPHLLLRRCLRPAIVLTGHLKPPLHVRGRKRNRPDFHADNLGGCHKIIVVSLRHSATLSLRRNATFLAPWRNLKFSTCAMAQPEAVFGAKTDLLSESDVVKM